MKKSSIIFGILMFLVSGILSYLNLDKNVAVNISLIANNLIAAIILATSSAIAFRLGVKKVGILPTHPKIVTAVLFAFFLGNTFSNLFSLGEVSWFLFAAVVIALSYFAPLILLKPKESME